MSGYLKIPKGVFFEFPRRPGKGFGASVGFTLLAALLLYVLQKIVR